MVGSMPILPLGRNTNYSPGATPVRGNDLNDIQDCIIGKKHGTIRRSVPLILQYNDTGNSWSSTPINGTGLISTGLLESSAGPSWFQLPFDVGDEISGIEVNRRSI